jgi:MFS family permease
MHARTLFLLCLASGAWAFAFGLGSQVCTHWLKHHGASDTLIGLNHACYYLGVALGSLCVARLARRLGTSCAAWGMVASGLTLALFPWGGGTFGWFVLRLVNGWASALSLIPLETLVSRASRPTERARNFGCYGVALTVGGALGIGAGLHFYRPGNTLAFSLGSVLPLLAALLVFRLPDRAPALASSAAASVPPDLGRKVLSYGTAWCQGFLEGGMLAFLSLYLLAQGLSADTAGALMGIAMLGVILLQVPVGWLAARCGSITTLLGCYALVIAALLAIPFCPSVAWLAVGLFVFGASSGALYPLGLSLLGEAASENQLARAFAGYLAMECLGSQLGAATMGRARDLWGEPAMFAAGIAAALCVPITWGGWQWYQRGRRPESSSLRLYQLALKKS